jgi:uncharacterized protein (TIGR03435 family)
MEAYGGIASLHSQQIVGGPSWIDADQFNIEATADCSRGPISTQQLHLMLQAMLEERFQLKAHMEKRELPIYELLVAENGLKMTRSADQTSTGYASALCDANATPWKRPTDPNAPLPRGKGFVLAGVGADMSIRYSAATMSQLVRMLDSDTHPIIIDKTGVEGLFDIKLRWHSAFRPAPKVGQRPAEPIGAAPFSSTLEEAMQQQLGLKLELTKGLVDVLIIDSVQKPMRIE